MLKVARDCKSLRKTFVILYMLLGAFLIVTICSRSSFLYPFNNWNDANCFFTVGKSMFNGIVLYRDIYEQKGPLLYFIYGVGYLMSHTTFIGVFFIEVIFACVYMFALYKIARLYVGFIPSLAISALSVAALYSSATFYFGGSAEELCLPFAAVPMYFLLQCFKNGDGKMAWYKMLISGFCAGCIFLIKYTILSFAIMFVLFVIIEFIRRKNYSGIWKAALLYLGGAMIAFVPWIIYFGVNGAFKDFYTVYIYNNIFLYGKRNFSGGIISSIYSSIINLRNYFCLMSLSNSLVSALFVIAVLWSALGGVFKIKIFSMDRIFIPLSCLTVFVFVCVGKYVFEYYYIPVGVFAVFGFIGIYSTVEYIVKYICGVIKRKKERSSYSEPSFGEEHSGDSGGYIAESENVAEGGRKKRILNEYCTRAVIALAICIAALGASVGICFGYSINVSYIGVNKDDLFMFKFASIIKEKGGKTLLNYGYLDLGLYTVTDILPTCKYFCGLNIALSEIYETQNEFVTKGKVDFIVCEGEYPDYVDWHYTLAATDYRRYDGSDNVVYLFEKTH